MVRWLGRAWCYSWAFFPGTVIGLLGAAVAVISGGQVRSVDGVLEVHGGWIARWLDRGNRWVGSIAAITFGHVVWGANPTLLELTRTHERVHVRQYEIWGPLFIPAYLLASLWLLLTRGDPYRDNPFEVAAYAVDDPRPRRPIND